ncbi:ABC transporter permease [Demequina sp. SO4-18]|uniref:ABC transporter permease n=1 Tax=Demequina sp. SO4-18 TaxID=3401026 RepID=UPI003B58FB4D
MNAGVHAHATDMVGRIQRSRGSGRMLVLVLVFFTFFAVLEPQVFLNPINLQNIMMTAPEIGLLSLAIMLAMLTGGIDLSVVSIANLSAITIATLYINVGEQNPELAASLTPLFVLAGVAVGMLGGLFNGFLVAKIGITPILATLATMQIYNGLAIVWTGGTTLAGQPAGLGEFGRSAIAGVPMLFVVFIVIAVVIGLIINRTPIGLKVQLQGANPVAARYTGIRSGQVLGSTYLLTGLLGGLAGVFILARNPTASADFGSSYVLLVIVIAVLGGTNPMGGFASVLGVVLATLTLQIVSSGFTALRMSPYAYAIAQGVILIAVMIVDSDKWRDYRSRWKKSRSTQRSQLSVKGKAS